MTCAFQLNAYQIENVAIASNENFDRKLEAHTGDIAASIDIAPHAKNAAKYRLILEIQVKPAAKKEKEFFPYLVAIKGRAFFTFKEPCPSEEADRVLRLNGASILYGLLRAQVAQITAQSVYGQFLLPTMNFLELAKPQAGTENGSTATVGEKPTSDGLYGGTTATPSVPLVRKKPDAYPSTSKADRPNRTSKDRHAPHL